MERVLGTVSNPYTINLSITEDSIHYRKYLKIYDGDSETGNVIYSITDTTTTFPSPLTVECATGLLTVIGEDTGSSGGMHCSVGSVSEGITFTSAGGEVIFTVTADGTVVMSVTYNF